VRRKRLLPISGALHGPQNLFEIRPHMPRIRSRQFGEPNPLQNRQAGKDVLRTASGRFKQFRDCGILQDPEIGRVHLLRALVRIPEDRAI
jgi:hypothetical protein